MNLSFLEFIRAFFCPFPENLRSYRLANPFFGTQNDIFNNPKTTDIKFLISRSSRWQFSKENHRELKAFRTDNLPTRSVGCPWNLSFLTRIALTVHCNPELFTEQIAGIVMDSTLLKLNDGFMIGKPNTVRSPLKMTIPRPLPTTSKPLDITSSGITLNQINYLK